jgi:hypothetical protein
MQTIKHDDEAGNRQSRKIDFDIRIVHSVEEVDQAEWDALGGGKPFSSHRWYRYGEKTMSDCIPVYILLYQQDQLLDRRPSHSQALAFVHLPFTTFEFIRVNITGSAPEECRSSGNLHDCFETSSSPSFIDAGIRLSRSMDG